MTDRADIPLPPEWEEGAGTGDFRAIGREFLSLLIRYGDLAPDHRVLDMGCGPGRIAAALTGYLSDQGSYEGFDVAGESVAWCSDNITAAYPRFRFQHAKAINNLYNPAGTVAASEFRFPYVDEQFDVALATSLFTHLLPQDAENYLREAARVLKPGGRLFATFHLLNAETDRLIESKSDLEPLFQVPHDLGHYRVAYLDCPEANVAYRDAFVLDLYERCGLRIRDPVHYGGWPGRTGTVTWQDLVVAVCLRGG